MFDSAKLIELLGKSGSDVRPSTEDFDKPFSDIGLDSLDVYNLLAEIELESGKKVSDDDFQHLNTLNDVMRFFGD